MAKTVQGSVTVKQHLFAMSVNGLSVKGLLSARSNSICPLNCLEEAREMAQVSWWLERLVQQVNGYTVMARYHHLHICPTTVPQCAMSIEPNDIVTRVSHIFHLPSDRALLYWHTLQHRGSLSHCPIIIAVRTNDWPRSWR